MLRQARPRTQRRRPFPALPVLVTVAAIALLAITVAVVLGTDVPGDSPDVRNGRVYAQDVLWTHGEFQYAAYVGDGSRPLVAMREAGGGWEVIDLSVADSSLLGDRVDDDPHRVVVVGVDASGTPHVAGNMHSDSWRGARLGPDGWTDDPLSDHAGRVTYPQFVELPDGTLLLARRAQYDDGAVIAIDRIAPDGGDGSWEPVGVAVDGRPSGEWPYLHRLAVGDDGVIHAFVVWRRGRGELGNGDLTYARSPDGGTTWYDEHGARLGRTVTHDEVGALPGPSGGWLNQGSAAVSDHGTPHAVTVARSRSGRRIVHHWLDDGEWHFDTYPGDLLDNRPALAWLAGGPCLVGAVDGWLRTVAVDDGAAVPGRKLAWVGPDWEVTYDAAALGRHGRLAMLVPDGDRPIVVETERCG